MNPRFLQSNADMMIVAAAAGAAVAAAVLLATRSNRPRNRY